MYSQKAHFWVESISIFVTCPFLKLEHTELRTVLEILFFSVYIDITVLSDLEYSFSSSQRKRKFAYAVNKVMWLPTFKKKSQISCTVFFLFAKVTQCE